MDEYSREKFILVNHVEEAKKERIIQIYISLLKREVKTWKV